MSTFADDISHLMNVYNEWRAKWLARFGTDDGFNEWFTQEFNRLTSKEMDDGAHCCGSEDGFRIAC